MDKYEACLEACRQCLIDCKNCLIQMSGKESMNDCPTCCILCIEAYNTCIAFLMADSKYAKEYCKLCAEVCQWCAEQCGQHDHDHCLACAESCVTCMEACRAIA